MYRCGEIHDEEDMFFVPDPEGTSGLVKYFFWDEGWFYRKATVPGEKGVCIG